MTLDATQRRDLTGLATGLGDAESDARAWGLLDRSFEARHFLREVEELGNALRPVCHQVLSRAEAIRMAGSIRRRGNVWHRPRAWLAVAASLLLVTGLSLWLRAGNTDQNIAFAVSIPGGTQPAGRYADVKPVHAGDAIESRNDWVVIAPRDGSRIVLGPDCRFRLQDARSAVLDWGRLYWQGRAGLTVTSPDAIFGLSEGEISLSVASRYLRCNVFQGAGSVELQGRKTQLGPGEALFWSGGEEVRKEPVGEAPNQERQALDTAAGVLKLLRAGAD